VTDNTQLLQEEIAANCWLISADGDVVDQIKVDDFELFLKKVRKNRLAQLNASDVDVDLIYYSWFDLLACQLRFNLINSTHERLPFLAPVQLVETESEIIQSFLESNYHDGIPFSELKHISPEEAFPEIEEEEEHIVYVYQEIIRKGS
jgi:hypothetical protein